MAVQKVIRKNDITIFDGRRNRHRGKLMHKIGSAYLATRYMLICTNCYNRMESDGVPQFLRETG